MSGPKLDIKKVSEQAQKEVREEREAEAKEQVKDKLKELDDAKAVVRNVERELEDLYAELGE